MKYGQKPVAVEFTKAQPPYHPGESTRRTEKEAFALVSLGVAKYLDPPPGLDEFGEPIEEKAAPKPAPGKPKKKVARKAKPKAKAK